jgi:Ca2+-binding EF-hand superfamily protein
MVYVGKFASTAKSVDLLRNDLLRLFRRHDYDGGGITRTERRFYRNRLIALHRSVRIMAYLSNDLDGDGNVSTDEWNEALRATSQDRLIRRKNDETPPSESEIQAEMRALEKQVRDKHGDPDADGDGNFTYEEILEGVNAKLPHPDDPRLNQEISDAFDRDGDSVVSEGEFMDAVTPVLTEMDSNGDGAFSRDEITALYEKTATARRQLEALRKAEAEAMGLGPERSLPGLVWP